MTVDQYIATLGDATGHGWGFLAAYSLTWLACGLVWRRHSSKAAAYATLFQGLVALPLALALTALTPGPERPSMPGMDGVSVLLATGQLLGLPIVIFLVARAWFTLVPLAMVALLVVHFAPYSWLYGTPLYAVMGGVVAVGSVAAMASGRTGDSGAVEHHTVGATRVCFTTAAVMAGAAAIAWFL